MEAVNADPDPQYGMRPTRCAQAESRTERFDNSLNKEQDKRATGPVEIGRETNV